MIEVVFSKIQRLIDSQLMAAFNLSKPGDNLSIFLIMCWMKEAGDIFGNKREISQESDKKSNGEDNACS